VYNRLRETSKIQTGGTEMTEQTKERCKMKQKYNSYRIELVDRDYNFVSCTHFTKLKDAERHGERYRTMLINEHNMLLSEYKHKKYFTVWDSELICNK